MCLLYSFMFMKPYLRFSILSNSVLLSQKGCPDRQLSGQHYFAPEIQFVPFGRQYWQNMPLSYFHCNLFKCNILIINKDERMSICNDNDNVI